MGVMISGPSVVEVGIGSDDGSGGASVGAGTSCVVDALASGGGALDSVTAGGATVGSLADGTGESSGLCKGGVGCGSGTTGEDDDESTGAGADDVDDGSGATEGIGASVGPGTGAGAGGALGASGASVGLGCVTVVYCVMMTTGGGCGGSAAESVDTLEQLLETTVLDCSAGKVFCASVGTTGAKGLCDEDSLSVGDGDGKTVVY